MEKVGRRVVLVLDLKQLIERAAKVHRPVVREFPARVILINMAVKIWLHKL